jgi:hypothetical protein
MGTLINLISAIILEATFLAIVWDYLFSFSSDSTAGKIIGFVLLPFFYWLVLWSKGQTTKQKKEKFEKSIIALIGLLKRDDLSFDSMVKIVEAMSNATTVICGNKFEPRDFYARISLIKDLTVKNCGIQLDDADIVLIYKQFFKEKTSLKINWGIYFPIRF